MPKYNVHAFAVVRVKLENIEADDQRGAIKKVMDCKTGVDFQKIFDTAIYYFENDVEFAEEVAYFLVDEVGDENYTKSQWHNGDFQVFPLKKEKGDIK